MIHSKVKRGAIALAIVAAGLGMDARHADGSSMTDPIVTPTPPNVVATRPVMEGQTFMGIGDPGDNLTHHVLECDRMGAELLWYDEDDSFWCERYPLDARYGGTLVDGPIVAPQIIDAVQVNRQVAPAEPIVAEPIVAKPRFMG